MFKQIRFIALYFLAIFSILYFCISIKTIRRLIGKISSFKEYVSIDNRYYQKILDEASQKKDANMSSGKPMEKRIEMYGIQKYKINQLFSNWCYPVSKDSYTAYYNSEFGWRIFRGKREFHYGIDFVSPFDSRAFTVNDGDVFEVGHNHWHGKYVDLLTDGIYIRYAHLDQIYVKEGQSVKRKEVLGLIGSTGIQSGVHLHFEIKIKTGNQWIYMNYVTNSLHGKKIENLRIKG